MGNLHDVCAGQKCQSWAGPLWLLRHRCHACRLHSSLAQTFVSRSLHSLRGFLGAPLPADCRPFLPLALSSLATCQAPSLQPLTCLGPLLLCSLWTLKTPFLLCPSSWRVGHSWQGHRSVLTTCCASCNIETVCARSVMSDSLRLYGQ